MNLTEKEAYAKWLEFEYKRLREVPANEVYDWAPAPGEEPPRVRRYIVTYHVPTYVDGGARLQRDTQVEFVIPSYRPDWYESSLGVRVVGGEAPFHPNCYASGGISFYYKPIPEIRLDEMFGYVARFLAFDPKLIELYNICNYSAVAFVKENGDKFPTMEFELPKPPEPKRRFTIIHDPKDARGK